jgi:alanine dehydrogenase
VNIGIPVEIKPFERRVSLLPAAAAELTALGHNVFMQTGAGVGSGYADTAYIAKKLTRHWSDSAGLRNAHG